MLVVPGASLGATTSTVSDTGNMTNSAFTSGMANTTDVDDGDDVYDGLGMMGFYKRDAGNSIGSNSTGEDPESGQDTSSTNLVTADAGFLLV